jgi:hypothetical protein
MEIKYIFQLKNNIFLFASILTVCIFVSCVTNKEWIKNETKQIFGREIKMEKLIVKYKDRLLINFLQDTYEIDIFKISENDYNYILKNFEEIKNKYPIKTDTQEKGNYNILCWNKTPMAEEIMEIFYSCSPIIWPHDSLKKQKNAKLSRGYYKELIEKEGCYYCAIYKDDTYYLYLFDVENNILIMVMNLL